MTGKRYAELQRTHPEADRATSPATPRSEASSSRKPSPTGDQSNLQINFQFLNFSHPSDAKTGKTRRAVRSFVTTQQHKRENAARRAKSYQADAGESDEVIPQRHHAATFPPAGPVSLETPGQASTPTESSETSSPSASRAPSPINAPQRTLNPSEFYPEEWHPYLPQITEHYLSNMAVNIPELDGPEASGLMRRRFFPFALTDPAPLHATILLAASHYGKARGSRSHKINLLQLQGMAIREINGALTEPARASSDQLIAAVANMAQYEALFGDNTVYNMHMTGLVHMVNLRGGLPSLGLDGLLERILLWIDSNASQITGSRIYFDKTAFPTSVEHPRPDPASFSGGLIK